MRRVLPAGGVLFGWGSLRASLELPAIADDADLRRLAGGAVVPGD